LLTWAEVAGACAFFLGVEALAFFFLLLQRTRRSFWRHPLVTIPLAVAIWAAALAYRDWKEYQFYSINPFAGNRTISPGLYMAWIDRIDNAIPPVEALGWITVVVTALLLLVGGIALFQLPRRNTTKPSRKRRQR
jgi:hypothetical protein